MVFDGSGSTNADRLKLFLNGVETALTFGGTIPATTASNANAIIIGEYNSSFFDGKIDDTKIWDRALSQKEIAYEYNKGLPVSWWQMEDNAASTTVLDRMQRNNGTAQANTNTKTTTGKFNSGLTFDVSSDYVNVTDDSSLDTDTWTAALWYNTSSADSLMRLLTKQESGTTNALGIEITNGVLTGSIFSGSTVTVTDPDTSNDGSWHHGVLVRVKDNSLTLYRDGIQVDTVAESKGNIQNNAALQIGGLNWFAGQKFTGTIDDVRIYNYALSASEVKEVMNQGSALRFGPTSGNP